MSLFNTTQQSQQQQKLSPQGLALQEILSRYALNWLQQGPQTYPQFQAAGARQYPTPALSLADQFALDPSGLDKGIAGITHPFTPGGQLSLGDFAHWNQPGGAALRQALFADPQIFGGPQGVQMPRWGTYQNAPQGQQGLTLLDLLRAQA